MKLRRPTGPVDRENDLPGVGSEGRGEHAPPVINDAGPASAPVFGWLGEGGVSPAELALSVGFALAAVSFGLFPSVMVWMLSLFTLPFALLFLAIGLFGMRGTSAPGTSEIGGLTLMLLAAMGLAAAAVGTNLVSCHLVAALGVQRVDEPGLDGWWWAGFAAVWAATFFLLNGGLRLWTDWTVARRRFWSIVLWMFPAATMTVHFTLAALGILPMRA